MDADKHDLPALRVRRAALVTSLESILGEAESQCRVLSEHESSAFERLKLEIASLDQSIEAHLTRGIPMDTEQPAGQLRSLIASPGRLSDGVPGDIAEQLTRAGRVSWEVRASLANIRRNIVSETLPSPDVAVGMPATWRPPVDGGLRLQPTLFELLPHIPVTGTGIIASRIDYTQPNNVGDKAAQVLEGAIKPESDLVISSSTVTWTVFAHTIRVTRQCLADVPGLRQVLDGILIRGLLRVVDGAVFTALTTAAGTFAPPGEAVNSADVLTFALAQLAALGGTNPTAVVNPQDLAKVNTLKCAGSGCYLGMPATSYGRIVASSTIPAGQFVAFCSEVGYFAERESVTVLAGLANDDFVRNLIRLLCELRGAVVIEDPRYLIKGDIAAPAAPENPEQVSAQARHARRA